MIREQTAPSSPGTDFVPPQSDENYDPARGTGSQYIAPGRDPILHASSRNNHSLFSFGRQGPPTEEPSNNGSFEFLPTPSFDDLHSSITTASHALKTQFLVTDREETNPGDKAPVQAMDVSINEARGSAAASRSTRHARTGSFLRKHGGSTRQSGMSSTTSTASGSMDPPSASLAMRNRRPNQYPPISGSGTTHGVSKPPRKSIGPGLIDSDFSKPAPRRRPSLASRISTSSSADGVAVSTRVNIGSATTLTDGARGLTTSRATKTKSFHSPTRQGQPQLAVRASTPEHSRSLSYTGKSPGRANGRGTNTPSSAAKRMSVVPGMPLATSHATGLGARTVSPTDTRRAKRLSILQLQNVPPIPNTPPPLQPERSVVRTSSRSPSMLPRKVSTPSSSRTTPDINRNQYSSGLSTGSNTSYNTSRTSTGSLQPRTQAPSSSRLPTPKPRNVHSSAGNEDEEDVPPVPAIPKAYESPKDSPAEVVFSHKPKSNKQFDASSTTSSSTNSLSGGASVKDPVKHDREIVIRKYGPQSSSSEADQNHTTTMKKSLQPLRLPPLNLLPLSTPTAAKIAALHDASTDGNMTPPPRRGNTKTPSTPMTASKASFFSRNRSVDTTDHKLQHIRSSSSIRHIRSESSRQFGVSSSESTKPMNISQPRQTVSPFLSSSLPKNIEQHPFISRSNTTGDLSALDITTDNRHPRLNGPRAPKLVKQEKSPTPPQLSSPEEPTTPSSASSLRRKLSLGWKRNTSKSNINLSQAANEKASECAPQPPKHDNMPPPRLPASATMNNLSSYAGPSPSPSTKSTTYLDSKRRKSSISNLAVFNGHDRTRSDSWGVTRSPKKETSDAVTEKPTQMVSRTKSSVIHKVLSSKASSSTIRSVDPWTADLDKDDMSAEDEMKKLASKRKETELAAKQLDALRKRATPKDHVSPQQAIQMAHLNLYERGEIVDYKDVYFCGTQNAAKHVGDLQSEAANFGYDDERGDYTIAPGDHLSYRYEIVDILGKGSFGQVVRCIDHKTGGLVAVKIIRNKKRFHQQALVEVNILQKLREWDPNNKYSMVSFTQSFYFRGHLCISTELLDMNLYEFIKSNGFRGFSLKIVRRFTKQLLNSLLLLKQHKVIHCDLKPENVLLTHPMHSEIKVIDFGSSCFENEKVYTYIQSRFYRSPEVILGMTYGMPIDMWSLGCILAELFTGVPIFPGENEQEQLACIMEVFGPPEKHLIEKSTRRKLFFDSLGKPRLTVSSKGRRRRPSSKTLQQVLKCDDEPFLDFLTRCLRWDPDRRMKPDEAVRHEFLTGQKSSAPISRMTSRNESPIKRSNTNTAPSAGNRPLPEPPATSFKNGTAVRSWEAAGASPIKPVPTRRLSTIGSLNSSTGSKRVSTGPISTPGSSGLPRVTRSVSARQDLASAGATAAMSRRA